MANIYIFSTTNVQVCSILDTEVVDPYVFQLIKDNLSIRYHDTTYTLSSRQEIELEHRIYFINEIKSWSLYPIQSSMQIGRSSTCDLCIDDSHISKQHILLEEKDNQVIVSDLQSTNGTYVNQKRIQTTTLRDGDQIMIACVELYYVNHYLILNALSQGSISKPKIHPPHEVKPWLMQWKKVSLYDVKTFEIELPKMIEEPKKNNLFQAIGSSLLILASSTCTTGLYCILQNKKLSEMTMMWMSSVSMSIAFLVYGLINRRIQWKEVCIQNKTDRQQYMSYLKDLQIQIQTYQMDVIHSEHELLEQTKNLDKTTYGIDYPILLGMRESNCVHIQHSKIGYQDKERPLFKKLEEKVREWSQPILRNVYLEMGQHIWIQTENIEYVHYIFAQMLWTQRKYSWYIQLSYMPYDDILYSFDNVCRADHVPLHESNYVFCTDSYTPTCKDDAIILYISLKETSMAFDTVIKENQLISIQNLRCSLRNYLAQVAQQKSLSFIDSLTDMNLHWEDDVQLDTIVGFDDNQNWIHLHFTEDEHGSHGLVAGMTGSGKSEWLSSMLMQLVIHNSPKLFQYILIDFKGGAFGHAFYEFPHCAGLVTDLDQGGMSRFIASMQYEIKKRQLLMKEHMHESLSASGNIDDYNAHHSHKLSHLFIIVDEFAQLKMKFPDYMNYLKEIARIGRSLGIHLILSTQKPYGIVDDQIWANAKWRVCLKVNSDEDSREVLKHNKAASLKYAGQFIVQVGNNELEHIGKGFYLQEKMQKDTSWKEFNESGECIRLSSKAIPSVLEYFSKLLIAQKLEQQWIVHPNLNETKSNGHYAIVDLPEIQKQKYFDFNFGHMYLVLIEDEDEVEVFVQGVMTHLSTYTMYSYGFDHMDSYVDDTMYCYTGMHFHNVVLFVRYDENISQEWIDERRKENNIVICIITTMSTTLNTLKYDFDIWIALRWKSLEVIRWFLDCFKVPELKDHEALLKDHELHVMYIYPTKPSPLMRERKLLNINQHQCSIGLNKENRPIFWKQHNRLLICFAQKSAKDLIVSLLNDWKRIDDSIHISSNIQDSSDICVIDVLHDDTFLYEPAFIEGQYDFDMMWVGRGLEDYGHILKRKIPYNTSARIVYWSEGGCECIQ